MKLTRIVCGVSALSFVSIFLAQNIRELGEGVGYCYLAVAALLGVVLLFLSGRFIVLTSFKLSLLFLVLMLFYVFFNLYFDTGDFSKLFAYTLGTNGGIVFSVLLGMFISFIISDLFLSMRRGIDFAFFTAFLIILYLIFVLVLSAWAFCGHMSGIRLDLFLIEDQEGFYQRPGNFMIMQFIINCSLVVLIFLFRKIIGRIFFVISFVICAASAGIGMLLSQLIGSNAGFGFIAGLFIFLVAYTIVVQAKGFQAGSYRIGLKPLLLGWLGRRIFWATGIVSTCIFAVGVCVVHYFSIDLSIFRIFGFDSGHVSSVDSRLEIFRNNFIEHFTYSPIFGNAQVDALTTGEGSYVHSLLSILTHHGFVGFSLFVIFLAQMFIEMVRKQDNISLYTNREFVLFRFLVLGFMILFVTMTSYYTCMSFWFSIGALGLSLCCNDDEQQAALQSLA